MSYDEVRILLLGSMRVGKTSIVMSLINEEFPDETMSRVEEITIPADVTPENIPTQIVDFSAQDQTLDDARIELRRASVVCMVFAMDNSDSIIDLENVWLPLVDEVNEQRSTKIPVILVGNKTDLIDVTDEITNSCYKLMNRFPSIETTLYCSARNLFNLSEIFYYAQKSVLHPLHPIFNLEHGTLSDLCQKALIRIFTLCDRDRDGLLCDAELLFFQRYCFKNPLHRQGLNEIREVIEKGLPDGVTNYGINLKGFQYLQKLFIIKGHQETVWTILRKFGYDNKLNITDQYLVPEDDISAGCFVELSPSAIEFLTEIFHFYDKDKDGFLNDDEIKDICAICDPMAFYKEDFQWCSTNVYGHPDINGFLSFYVLYALNDFRWLYGHFTMLGYNISENNSQISAFQVYPNELLLTNSRNIGKRSTYVCKVFGPPKSGKTSLIHSIFTHTVQFTSLDHKTTELNDISEDLLEIVKVHYMNNKNYFITIHEVDWNTAGFSLSSDFYDVAIFLVDVTKNNSFKTIENYLKMLRKNSCIILLGNKSKYLPYSDECIAESLDFCRKNNIRPFQILDFSTIKKDECVKILDDIASLCVNGTCKNLLNSGFNCKSSLFKCGIILSVAIVIAYVFLRKKN